MPSRTRTTIGHSILAKLLHRCVSVFAVMVATGVVLFGVLPAALLRSYDSPGNGPCLPIPLNHKEIVFMAGFNKVILIGHLTRNPELRYTPNGTPVASFGLGVNRKWKQGDDMKEDVCFIDIVTFGKQAEHCGQYLTKGNGVIVDGRLQQRRWQTEDGQKRSKHEILAQTVTFLPKSRHTADHVDLPAEEPAH